MLSVLVRRGAGFATAEDAVQEALIRALAAWEDERPADPKGWLITVAWRAFLDMVAVRLGPPGRELRFDTEPRRRGTEHRRHAAPLLPVRPPRPDPVVGGGADAASRGRPHHPTDRRGLPRARAHDGAAHQPCQAHRRRAGIDRRGPATGDGDRVLYLVFNEGYSGDIDLAAEAIRLTRQLAALPTSPRWMGCSP